MVKLKAFLGSAIRPWHNYSGSVLKRVGPRPNLQLMKVAYAFSCSFALAISRSLLIFSESTCTSPVNSSDVI